MTPHQFDLLADTPRARTSDPATSHTAARRIKDSGTLGRQQRAVLALVQAWPGHTSGELAMKYAVQDMSTRGWQHYRPMVARRLPELEPVHVRKGAARTCAITGSSCVTWWPRQAP
jgi:hypothetical protein